MKIKLSEATPLQIDWMVARAVGLYSPEPWIRNPSTDWNIGGALIEREKIALIPPNDRINDWEAVHPTQMHDEQYGPTPLIAAMRAFVASRLGGVVEVPDEIL